MKNTVKYIILCLAIAYTSSSMAHEEPSKTLKEKNEKEQEKQQILKSKLKTVTSWKFVFEKNIETPVKHKAYVMGYDAKGNFSFIEAYDNDSLTERDEYTYSASGDMITENDYDNEGKIIEKNIFTYDKDGRVISGITKNENDLITDHFKMIHSKDKKNIEFIKYNSGDSIDHKFIYKYPDDYDKSDYSEASKYDANTKLILKAEKTYNPQGLQMKKIIFDKNNKISYFFLYEYDTKGNNIKTTKKLSDGSIEWVENYTYDNNGNCTEVKSYNKDNKLIAHMVNEFEYYK